MENVRTHYRTHTCGELRMEHVGQTVTLAGFLENVREVGQNFAFAVLRDFYGVTQVVIETEDMWKAFKGLNKESTVQITGVVRERDSKNPKLPTGDIEVVPQAVEVLGRCRHNELPFQVNRSREADESARLKYRYLDLRNPAVKNNIILRCQVVAALRKGSDTISRNLGDAALAADERLEESRQALPQKLAELEARRDFLQARILDTRLFGAARLMKAFPAMKDLRHSELLAELKKTLHERLHR